MNESPDIHGRGSQRSQVEPSRQDPLLINIDYF